MDASTTQQQPTVILVFGLGTTSQSAVAFDVYDELLETVTFDESGMPQWQDECVVVADERGVGGAPGFGYLRDAMEAAESNAALMGEVVRVDPFQWGREAA